MSSPMVHNLEDHMNYYIAWFIGGFMVPFAVLFLSFVVSDYFIHVFTRLQMIGFAIAVAAFAFILDPMVR